MKKKHIIYLTISIIFISALSLAYKNFFSKNSIVRETTIISPVYTVDRIYKSMMGPSTTKKITIFDSKKPELIWIKSFKAEMVDERGKSSMSQEFMCHSNLDINPKIYRENLNKTKTPSSRLFTLSQGQYEINFPEGFGIPILSTEALRLTTQVLNLNKKDMDVKVRHKVTLEYIRNKDLVTPLKPLVMVGATGLKSLDQFSSHYNIKSPKEEIHGQSCLIGENTQKSHVYKDKYGQEFTGHWVVKPGVEVNHTNVTKFMKLPFDTTLHYIAVHLHPFAETLELVDLTTKRTIFKSNTKNSENRIGIDHVDYFESLEGIPLHKKHQYQLISVYNNTSKSEQDSMAVMYLYVLDKDFDIKKIDPEYL